MTMKKLLLFIFGSSFISYIIFIRLILVRIPKEIYFLPYQGLIAVCLISLHIYIIYKYYQKQPKAPHKIIQKFLEYFYLSLQTVYDIFYKKIKQIEQIITFLSSYFYLNSSFEFFHKLFFFFDILPKLIVCIALFVDIVYYSKFEYLYKVIALLLIPTCYRIFNYALNHWSINIKAKLLDDAIIREFLKDNELKVVFIFKQKEKYHFEKIRSNYKNLYDVMWFSSLLYEKYNKIQKKYKNWFILIHSIYVISWLYMLYGVITCLKIYNITISVI